METIQFLPASSGDQSLEAFLIKLRAGWGGEEEEESVLVVVADAHLHQLEINLVGERSGGEGAAINGERAVDVGQAGAAGAGLPGQQNFSGLLQAAAQYDEGQLWNSNVT